MKRLRPMRTLRRLVAYMDGHAVAAHDAGSRRMSVGLWQLLSRLGQPISLTAVANELSAHGRIDEAFSLLRAGMFMGRKTRREARAFYWSNCTWLALAGFLREAESRLEVLESNRLTQKYSRRMRLKLWSNFAIFDPRIKPALQTYLPLARDTGLMRAALRLFYYCSGSGDAVLDAYQRELSHGGGTDVMLWADYFAIATQHAESGVIALAAGADLAALSQASSALHVDRWYNFDSDRAVAFVSAIEQANQLIWSELAKVDLTLAIVGNASTEIGHGRGADIDAHACVVRFNVPLGKPEFEIDYGCRTDLFVINQAVLNEPRTQDLHNCWIIITGPDWETFTHNKAGVERLIAQGCMVATMPQGVLSQLSATLLASASSGLQFCAAVCSARGNSMAGVSLFGFGFTDQVGAAAKSANYFRVSRPIQRHNWKGEALVFAALRATGGYSELSTAEVAAQRYENHLGKRDAYRPLRFRVDGDHSRYHCGSAAVVRHLTESLLGHGVITGGDDYDVMVMNGEGSMHHDSAHYRQKIDVMARALDAGRQVYLVNSVWQDNPPDTQDVLSRIERIYVRESMSQANLLERHGVSSTLYPDLSYYCPLDRRAPASDFSRQIVMTDFWSEEFGTFVRWTGAQGLKHPFIDMRKFTWSKLVASLATAEMLVTGRHHAVYAACRARVPFVAFHGNTHKIDGLLSAAGVAIPMCRSRDELPDLIEWARANREEYERLFDWLDAFPPWNPMI